jgi:hypothetical protein
MTARAEILDAARQPVIATIRPGPVLHLWCGDRELARVDMSVTAAMELSERLLCEARRAMGPQP